MTEAARDAPGLLGADGKPLPKQPTPRIQALQHVVLTFLGSGIALALMGFIGSTWVEHRLEREMERIRHDLARTLRDESTRIALLDKVEDATFAVRESYSGVLSGHDKVQQLTDLVSRTEEFQRVIGALLLL